MSTVIENQVVQMSFDNKEFEKNISTSMKSLENFKEEIEFSEGASNFKKLEKVSESMDFDKLNKAIDGVGDHFTLLGRVAYKITDQIADYFTNKITSMVNTLKSVTTDIIDPKAGYKKYDDYTHGVKNILAALTDDNRAAIEKTYGTAIDGVEAKLEELMAYTDETSYNFTDMVTTIGKFLGAGIDLDSAIADMQGIANWAALAGQNATTASQAMYQMSQALGAGYVKYQDWTQMANLKSMGTTAAKDVFIEAAKEVGTIKAEDLAHAKEILGPNATDAQIRNWFFEANQLNNENARWFTTEVLEKGLQTFSSVSNEVIPLVNELNDDSNLTVTRFIRMGNEMKKTGKSAKEMVDELVGNGKLSLADEDYDKVIKSLDKLTSKEYEVGWNALKAAQEATTFTEAIDATKDAVGTQWMKIFKDLIGNYETAAELWTDLANNLYDVFALPLSELEVKIKNWAESTITIVDDTGEEIEVSMRRYLWEGLSGIFESLGNLFGSLFDNLGELSDKTVGERIVGILDKIAKGVNNLTDVINDLAESETVHALSILIRDVVRIGKALFSIIGQIIGAIYRGIAGGDSLDYTLASVVETVDYFADSLAWVLEKLAGSKGFHKVLKLITNSLQVFVAVARLAMTVISNIAAVIDHFFTMLFGDLHYLGMEGDYFEYSLGALGKAIAKLLGVSEGASNKIVKIFKKIGVWIDEIFIDLYMLFGDVGKTLRGAPNFIAGIVGAIGTILSGFFTFVLKSIGDIFNIDTTPVINALNNIWNTIKSTVSDYFDKAKALWSSALSDLSDDIFEEIPKSWNRMVNNFKSGNGAESIEDVFKFIGQRIRSGVEFIIDSIGAVLGMDLTEFKAKILSFMDTMAESLGKIKPEFEAAWDTVGRIFGKLVDAFKVLADGLFDIIGRLTGIEDFGPDKFLDLIFWVLEKLVGILLWLVSVAADAIVKAGPFIMALADLISEGLTQIWLAFKYFIGADDSERAEQALENLRKVLMDVLIVIFILQVAKFFKSVSWALTAFSDLSDHITGWSPKSFMYSFTHLVKALAFMFLAFAILANQDIQGVAMAVIAFSVVIKLLQVTLKKILTNMEVIAKHIKKKVIDVEGLKAGMATVEQAVLIIAKTFIKIAVALAIIAWASDKFGGDNMLNAILGLSVMVVILAKSTSIIIKAADTLKNNEKKIKQIRKVIDKLVTSLTVIATAFGILTKIIYGTMTQGKNGEAAVEGAMLLLLGSLITLVLGTSMIILVSRWSSGNELKNVAKNIGQMAVMLSVIAIIVANMVNMIDLEDMQGLKEKFKYAMIALAAICGLIVVLAFVLSKILKKDVVTNLSSAAQIMAESIGSMLMLGMAVVFLSASVELIILSATLIALLIAKGGGPWVILESMGLAVLIYLAAAAMFLLLSQVEIKSDPSKLMSAGLMMLEVTAALLLMAWALKALQDVSIDDDMKETLKVILIVMAVMMGFSILASLLGANLGAISALALGLAEFAGALYILAGALFLFTLFDMSDAIEPLMDFGKTLLMFLAIIGVISMIAGLVPGAVKVIQALANACIKFAIALGILMIIALAFAIFDTLVDDILEGIETLKTRVPELVEALIQLLVITLDALGDSLITHAEELGEGLYKVLLGIVGIAFTLMSKLWEESFGPFLEEAWDKICEFFSWIGDGLEELFFLLGNAWDWFYDHVIQPVIDAFLWIDQSARDFIAAIIDAFDRLGDFIDELVEQIAENWNDFWEGCKEFFGNIIKLPGEAINSLITGLHNIKETVVRKIRELASDLVDVIKGKMSLRTFGEKVLNDLVDGMRDAVTWVVKKIKSICNDCLDAIKSFFGIGSPSKETAEDGKYLMEGLAVGMEKNKDVATDAAEEVCDDTLETMRDTMGIHSASKKTTSMGSNLIQGLKDGLNNDSGGLLETVKTIGGNVISSFKDKLGGAGDILSVFTGGLSTDSFEIPGYEVPDMTVDNFNIEGYNYTGQAFDASSIIGANNIYSMGAVYDGSAVSVPVKYNPTVTDAQVEQISSSYEDNSQEVINAINDLKEEVSKQAEVISKIKIVLDTGTLVGEIADPINKALGNKAKLSTGRGI